MIVNSGRPGTIKYLCHTNTPHILSLSIDMKTKTVTFTLPAEALGSATEAILLGDFNEWNLEKGISLTVQPDGTLAAAVALKPGTYEYRFFLNNGTWVNDWAAQAYVYKPEFGIDNSVITVEEATATTSKKPAKKVARKSTTSKAAAKKAKAVVEKDDLTKIEGIGTKIAKLLEAEGISTYKELGKTTIKKLKSILEAAGTQYQMHDPKSWPKQAKLAAAGNWEELAALQKTLIKGK